VVLEDVHWADEATLDLLRWLGRRLGSTRTLLIATYRDEELGPGHPLRFFLGDVATSATAHRLTLPPLSKDAVRFLASGTELDASALHRVTGGNPFLVTEVLGAPSDGVPDTVRDAVLARISRLSKEGQTVLEIAAVIGMRIEQDLLEEVAEAGVEAADESLAIGILRVEGDHLTFRHELTRVAMLESVPPMRLRHLNGRVLAALVHRVAANKDFARLAHHAEESGNRDAVLNYADAAARQAIGLRAHREAAAQYARALRSADAVPAEDRALLLEAHSYECYLTEQITEAIDSRRAALEIWNGLGNRLKAGETQYWLSRICWYAGQNEDAAQAGAAALEILEAEPPGRQLAWAYSNVSALRMLAQDHNEAIAWGERAISLAEHLGENEVLVHALNNLGSARLLAGDEGGREPLEQSLALARAGGFDEHAARAFVNLAWQAVHARDLKAADHYLDEGISYCTEHNLDHRRVYMVVTRAIARLRQGRWTEATDDAGAVLRDPNVTSPTRIHALVVMGTIGARRGDNDPWPALDEALHLAAVTGELQRVGPVRAARAEAAWLGGRTATAAEEARAGLELVAGRRDLWLAGELALLLWRTGDAVGAPKELAEPFALEMVGQPQMAAERWSGLGCPYEAAQALAATDDETDLRTALAEFERLGARPSVAAITRRLRTLGAKDIPRGPRPATRANAANLTSREVEILDLVALGLRDAEIADRLFLSPKTVGHHVSSILSKLGVRSRAEASNLMRDRELLRHT
jgi:DNA-binding CsgD family transcriptional regulator/tetratricopeptide (TPR) repeat protein